MRVGVIGLGHLGFPIANHFHTLGCQVFSWTRVERTVPWQNSIALDESALVNLDVLVIASGAVRPNHGDETLELSSTLDLVSNLKFSCNTKIVYISSGAVYGECARKQNENESARPTTIYGKSKLNAEKQLSSIFGSQLFSLRLSNVIDEKRPYGVFELLAKGISSNRITFLGEPTDCRDYIGIDDFLSALEVLIRLHEPPNILNIGSGENVTLGQIASLLRLEKANKILISWSNRRPGDLSRSMLEIRKMNEILGIFPNDPLPLIHNFIKNLN